MPKIKKKKRATPEKKIQNDILEYLTKEGFMVWRNNNTGLFDPASGTFRRKGKYQMLGISDIFAIAPRGSVDPGRFIAIEVKTEKGKPTVHQEFFINKINENGGLGFVARSIKDVEENLFLI